MSSRQVSYRTASFGALVNQADPARLTSPEVEYNFGNRQFSRQPTLPGREYKWISDINPHDDDEV